jgi:hypothetical protein
MSESHDEPKIPPPEPLPPSRADEERELAELLERFADITNRHQRAFLAGFAVGKGIRAAQRLSGVNCMSHYEWLDKDRLYRERFELVERLLADEAEEEAYRRAFSGYETSTKWRGKTRSEHKSYSDALAIFLLKGMKPERYARRAGDFDFRGPTGIDITIRKEGEEPKDVLGQPVISIPRSEPEE